MQVTIVVYCSRQDQLIQEIYLEALKNKVGEVAPEYFMTDDDPKYYNAWIKVMGNLPRRLICTWHVVKNWNIQGKAKIKNEDIKKTMKTDLHKIMTEVEREKFKELYQKYFETLEKCGEIQFLNYLKK